MPDGAGPIMVFLDFNLPNATTWFYLSLMLAVGMFFKFNRFFSLRNWDILTLYLLVPGFLFLQQAYRVQPPPATFMNPEAAGGATYGFVWLMIGSLCFFIRCLIDMTLVSRPAMTPNLNLAGLAWFAGALFLCMVPVAIRTTESEGTVGRKTAALDVLNKASTQTVEQVQQLAGGKADNETARFWVQRSIALLAHLAVVAALVLIGAIHFGNVTSGMAAGTFYLLLPYTAYHVGQAHHVLPAALLIWAVYAYRRPWLVGLLLGIAAGTCFFPALTVPIWLSFYRKGGSKRFLIWFAAAAGVSLGLTGLILWLDGSLSDTLRLIFSLTDWQPWRRSGLPSIWNGMHGAYRLPVFILYVALVILTGFWPTPKNLGHVIALSAAILIGIQFWYADQGGVYVLWYLPLLVLLIFRPNLSDRYPPPQPSSPPWLSGLIARLVDWVVGRIQPPEPAQTV
jgi:hypothetical protein